MASMIASGDILCGKISFWIFVVAMTPWLEGDWSIGKGVVESVVDSYEYEETGCLRVAGSSAPSGLKV
jgi:hypothetical protein